jgi:hypothetical protein
MDNNNLNEQHDFAQESRFNVKQFNKQFETQKDNNKEIREQEEKEKLDKLNETIATKPLLLNNVQDVLLGIKNSWFNVLDALLYQKFTGSTLFKNNEMFYIGITFVMIGLILFIFDFLSDEKNSSSKMFESYTSSNEINRPKKNYMCSK